MMTNLFSSFDPSSSNKFSMNWMTIVMMVWYLPVKFWIKNSRALSTYTKLLIKMNQELKTTLNNKSSEIIIMMMSVFIMIICSNYMGLMPYVFTPTSHMSVNLALATPMWGSILLFSWINKTKMTFMHLTPMGTPGMLMPFMVLIEMISNMIRPISLSVRLTANMITGHLLMSLMETTMQMKTIPIMMMQMMLMTFELTVAFIQAYVFMVLMTLYISEVNYDKQE